MTTLQQAFADQLASYGNTNSHVKLFFIDITEASHDGTGHLDLKFIHIDLSLPLEDQFNHFEKEWEVTQFKGIEPSQTPFFKKRIGA